VLAAGKPVVAVLFTSNPYADLEADGLLGRLGALVHAFYPQRWAGPALADVLAGVASPAGRLPYSWPRSLADAGDIADYSKSTGWFVVALLTPVALHLKHAEDLGERRMALCRDYRFDRNHD